MQEDDYWGELRSRLQGSQEREAFVDLWGWLAEHPSYIEREEVRGYLRDHLLQWPKESRVLWEDELKPPLERFKLWLSLTKPRLASAGELTSSFDKEPAALPTPFGEVTLSCSLDGRLVHAGAEHAGVHHGDAAHVWLWEHPDWSVQIQAHEDPISTYTQVQGGVLFSYRLLAHASIKEQVLLAQWHPHQKGARLSEDSRELFDAQTWSGETESAEWDAEELPSPQFCLGTNGEGMMVEEARTWWPGNRESGSVELPRNGLRIRLPRMQAGQRMQAWVVATWGHHPTGDMETWMAAQELLCEPFKKIP